MAQALGPWAFGIFLGVAAGLGIDDEVAVALLVQGDVLALVPGDLGEAHLGEQRAQQLDIRRGIFDELEAVGAHRVGEAVAVFSSTAVAMAVSFAAQLRPVEQHFKGDKNYSRLSENGAPSTSSTL